MGKSSDPFGEEEKKEGCDTQTISLGSSGAYQVYVRSAKHGWVPARVMSIDKEKDETIVAIDKYTEEQAMLSSSPTATGKEQMFSVDLKYYSNGVLPLQNTTESGELMNYEDMIKLPYLHEVCVMK